MSQPTPRLTSGSYKPDDCLFLLSSLEAEYVSVEEKERLIQSGRRHYSEMISYEAPPSPRYQSLFLELTARYKSRLAQEVLSVAQQILSQKEAPLTVVSLARAGTPFGALLQRAFRDIFKVDSVHYSLSIIRDRGIDERALSYILREAKRPPQGLVFVDTWTAKGVITRELKRAIQAWNEREAEQLSSKLYVISDIGGTADVAATYDDYAIPSGVMNATVSGLMSRSILNEKIGPSDFHGSVFYAHLSAYDQSEWFLDQVSAEFNSMPPATAPSVNREERHARSMEWVARWQNEHQISDVNHIKPGVAEATRVMLRRVPACLLLRDQSDPDVAHLLLLAEEKSVPVLTEPEMPFKAAAFIKAVSEV